MRIRNDRAQDEPHIDLVPLIDVILVLIIFFVVTTTFDVRSTLQLQLPVASPQAPPPARTLDILVNADGRYFIGEREVLRTGIDAVKQAIADAMYRALAPGGLLLVADYGMQRTFLMRTLFRQVQMLDGFDKTEPNARGCMPGIFAAAGFEGIDESKVIRTPTGSISIYQAQKPSRFPAPA